MTGVKYEGIELEYPNDDRDPLFFEGYPSGIYSLIRSDGWKLQVKTGHEHYLGIWNFAISKID